MKMTRWFYGLILFLICNAAAAQGNGDVQMADVMRRDGKIYAVVIGLVTILTGFIILLLRVERKVNKLNKP